MFVTVPRPLFVEEFGLKRLMETSGTSLPISRSQFESGQWSAHVLKAWEMGREKKAELQRRHMKGEYGVKASEIIAKELEGFMRE